MPLFYYVIGTTVLDGLDGPKLLLSHLLNYMKAHVPWLWSGKTEVSTSFLSFIDLSLVTLVIILLFVEIVRLSCLECNISSFFFP